MRNVFFIFSMLLFVTSVAYAYPVNEGKGDAYIIHQVAQYPAYNIQVRPAPPPPRRDVDRRPAPPPPPRRDVDRRPAPPPRQEPAYNIQVRPAPPPPPRQEPAYNIQVRPAPPPPPRR